MAVVVAPHRPAAVRNVSFTNTDMWESWCACSILYCDVLTASKAAKIFFQFCEIVCRLESAVSRIFALESTIGVSGDLFCSAFLCDISFPFYDG